MSEGFTTTYAKAVDDMAGKIFIPGAIASILVELGPLFQLKTGADMLLTYLAAIFAGFALTALVFYCLALASAYLFKGENLAPFIGVCLMPLGFTCLFPDFFEAFKTGLSEVTGVALLAWSFMLLKHDPFGVSDDHV